MNRSRPPIPPVSSTRISGATGATTTSRTGAHIKVPGAAAGGAWPEPVVDTSDFETSALADFNRALQQAVDAMEVQPW